jgi:hypothetical protein
VAAGKTPTCEKTKNTILNRIFILGIQRSEAGGKAQLLITSQKREEENG